MGRPLANSAFANALGRPDLSYSAARANVGPPPIIVVGGTAGNSGITGQGQLPVIGLMALVGLYAGFTWWVRPHLA